MEVNLVEVDPVCPESPQAGLAGLDDMPAGGVHAAVDGHPYLSGDGDPVPERRNRAPKDFLRGPVAVGRVKQRDPQLIRRVDKRRPDGGILGAVHSAHRITAETDS